MVYYNTSSPSQRFSSARFNTDIVIENNGGDSTLDNEDVLIIGNYEDYSGSGVKGPSEVLMQGSQNKLFGEEADLHGFRFGGVTDRGNPSTTTRSRKKLVFIDLKDKRSI